jgi:calcineurin-like phosphoesterase family protein
MPNTFFVSDTHFGHKNIILYSNRPFSSVDEMNNLMVKYWNEVVKPEDIVWHLGDFAFMPYKDFKSLVWRLNGHINVILGNHDKVIEQHRQDILNTNKIESIQNYKELKVEGNFIVLFHYGQRVWNKSHHDAIHLYGHSHGSLPPHGKSVDVGVDCKEITHEYRPVSLDEVVKYMSKRQGEVVDHHGTKDLKDD